jgi:hypothetical protein
MNSTAGSRTCLDILPQHDITDAVVCGWTVWQVHMHKAVDLGPAGRQVSMGAWASGESPISVRDSALVLQGATKSVLLLLLLLLWPCVAHLHPTPATFHPTPPHVSVTPPRCQ